MDVVALATAISGREIKSLLTDTWIKPTTSHNKITH
jgi:hypothetical protein